MGWRRRAGGGKRDIAEKPIVEALRAAGCVVRHIGGTGNPDLLVMSHGRWYPIEVKSGKAKRTKAQVAEGAGEYWPVVTTPEEALRWVREESNR